MKKCARPVERPKVGRVMGNHDFCTCESNDEDTLLIYWCFGFYLIEESIPLLHLL